MATAVFATAAGLEAALALDGTLMLFERALTLTTQGAAQDLAKQAAKLAEDEAKPAKPPSTFEPKWPMHPTTVFVSGLGPEETDESLVS